MSIEHARHEIEANRRLITKPDMNLASLFLLRAFRDDRSRPRKLNATCASVSPCRKHRHPSTATQPAAASGTIALENHRGVFMNRRRILHKSYLSAKCRCSPDQWSLPRGLLSEREQQKLVQGDFYVYEEIDSLNAVPQRLFNGNAFTTLKYQKH